MRNGSSFNVICMLAVLSLLTMGCGSSQIPIEETSAPLVNGDCNCPYAASYWPVCYNNTTYSSSTCLWYCEGIWWGYTIGECPVPDDSCTDNDDCASGEYCVKDPGDCNGIGKCEIQGRLLGTKWAYDISSGQQLTVYKAFFTEVLELYADSQTRKSVMLVFQPAVSGGPQDPYTAPGASLSA